MPAVSYWKCIGLIAVLGASTAFAGKSESLKEGLRNRLNAQVKASGIARKNLGLYVSLTRDGETAELYSNNATKLFIPASLSKVVTAGAVLSTLGPSKKFNTQLLANELESGVIEGPLYLRGFGDTGFVSEDMWVLVNDLTRTGVQVIKGGIVVDDSWFDRIRKDPTREGSNVDRAYAAPIGAMSFNWNSVNVYVRPGKKAGAPARVFADPENDYIRVINRAKTVDRGRTKIFVERKEGGDTFHGNVVKVSGQIALGAEEKVIYKSITKPDLWSGYNLKAFLQQRGIEVIGDVRAGSAPSAAKVLAEKESKALSMLIRDMQKYSNNYVAEMLTKHLAAESGEVPATMETGISILQQNIERWGLTDGLKIFNPSGLTRKNQMKPESLHDLLRILTQRFDVFPENLSSYPIAGTDGTLEKRMRDSAASGWVRAKTGLLTGVSGLAGYAGRKDGSVLTFVFLFNGAAGKTILARDLFDRMAVELVK